MDHLKQFRYTLTITPINDSEMQQIINDIRTRFGHRPLIHVIGQQPSGTHVKDAPRSSWASRVNGDGIAIHQEKLAKQASNADEQTQSMAAEAPVEPDPTRCKAADHPVWADGSQDHYHCRLPAGHDEGPHGPGHISIEENGFWRF